MPGKNASPVGRQIRAARQRAGLSQERLAEHLHVTRQAISNWESGKSLPDLETLKTLAEVLSVPIEQLIYEDRPAPRPLVLSPELWAVWCRYLGCFVLIWGLVSGLSGGSGAVRTPEGGVGWGFDWSAALSLWYPALIRSTILLALSILLSHLKDESNKEP